MPTLPAAVSVTPTATPPGARDAGAESGEFADLMAGLLGKDAASTDAPVDAATPAAPAVVDPALLVASGAPVAPPVAPPAPDTVEKKDPKLPTPSLPTPGPIERTGPTGGGSRPVDDGGEVPRTYGCTTGVVIKGPRPLGQPAPSGDLPAQQVAPAAQQVAPAQQGATTQQAPVVQQQPAQPGQPGQPGQQAPTASPAGAVTTPRIEATAVAPDAVVSAAAATDLATPADSATTDPLVAPAPAVPQPALPANVAQVAPTAPIVAAAPPAPAPVGPSHIPDQVTAQVFPEIGRLAVRATSAGEGIHRITLNLHPETLGDVRVTLVVRGGELKISIHAANEAGRIMADSIPELRRLLGSAGADAIVAVRDSGAGGATLNTADQGSNRSELDRSGYDAHQQGRDTHGRDARTRDGHIATDGSNSGARGTPPGPLDLVRDIRSAGVDVTV